LDRFLVNRYPLRNGGFQIHAQHCIRLGLCGETLDLGFHADADSALRLARRIDPATTACPVCSSDMAGPVARPRSARPHAHRAGY